MAEARSLLADAAPGSVLLSGDLAQALVREGPESVALLENVGEGMGVVNGSGDLMWCNPRLAGQSEAVRHLAFARQIVLQLAQRLARRGILNERDDIFFLKRQELPGALAGRPDVKRVVAARRAEYAHNCTLTPPPVVIGQFDPQQTPELAAVLAGNILQGLAVSPGRARGKARVILHTDDDQILHAGEILVAPFTDPGWTPYFLPAAAIVMDMGGLLSHGSIVAREYGIPCVVNVGAATKIVRTGQTIRVDADRGEVTILR